MFAEKKSIVDTASIGDSILFTWIREHLCRAVRQGLKNAGLSVVFLADVTLK